jgi:hypothetical protein
VGCALWNPGVAGSLPFAGPGRARTPSGRAPSLTRRRPCGRRRSMSRLVENNNQDQIWFSPKKNRGAAGLAPGRTGRVKMEEKITTGPEKPSPSKKNGPREVVGRKTAPQADRSKGEPAPGGRVHQRARTDARGRHLDLGKGPSSPSAERNSMALAAPGPFRANFRHGRKRRRGACPSPPPGDSRENSQHHIVFGKRAAFPPLPPPNLARPSPGSQHQKQPFHTSNRIKNNPNLHSQTQYLLLILFSCHRQ